MYDFESGTMTSDAGAYLYASELYTEPDEDKNISDQIPRHFFSQDVTADPWFNSSSCQKDFLLISEFSEIEGPKPLITIPKDAISSDFNVNDFCLRIMSTDHQANIGEKFSIREDSQTLLFESNDNIYAFIHHFTLYDSQARGFVRPFCLTYVTPCQSKLVQFNEEITTQFEKVSKYLKYGNLMSFVKDMTHYLTDLQYTREKLTELNNDGKNDAQNTEEAFLKQNMSPNSLDACIAEVKSVLEIASNLVDDEEIQAKFERFESTLDDNCEFEYFDSEKSSEALSSSWSFRRTFRTSSSPSFMKRNRSQRTNSMSRIQDRPRSNSYTPHLIESLNKRHFDEPLRTLHELCSWGAREGINHLRQFYKLFSSNYMDLKMNNFFPKDIDVFDVSLPLSNELIENIVTNLFSKRSLVTENDINEKYSDHSSVNCNQNGDSYVLLAMKDFNCAAHIVYTLLLGRPLIITASSKWKSNVRTLIETLISFVPGYKNDSNVEFWQTHPLRITDLPGKKIIGLHRKCGNCAKSTIPLSVQRYVSILNYDTNNYYGPAYDSFFRRMNPTIFRSKASSYCQMVTDERWFLLDMFGDCLSGLRVNTIFKKGKILANFDERLKLMKSYESFSSYIYSILQEFTNKVFIFCHMLLTNSSDNQHFSKIQKINCQNTKELLRKLCLSRHDEKIVQNLMQIVKTQIISRCSDHPREAAPTLKVEYINCQKFKS